MFDMTQWQRPTGMAPGTGPMRAPSPVAGMTPPNSMPQNPQDTQSLLSKLMSWGGWDSMFDKTNNETNVTTQGWGLPALQGALGAGNLLMGMKQYGLAKDSFKQSKNEFDMNWGANRDLTNSQLEDRQRARVASNPGAYESVGNYMSTYGIK
jgi:hypothetical protein